MHAVLLDIDGTLLHSTEEDDRMYRDAVLTVMGEVSLRPSLGDYDPVTDSGILLQIFADNALDPDPDMATAVYEAFVERMGRHLEEAGPFEPLPGAREFVRALKDSPGIALGIATGGWGATARMKLQSARFEIDDVPIATADDAVTRTDIMKIACARAGTGVTANAGPDFELDSFSHPFERITYFGDGEWDRVATRALGWSFRPVGPGLGGIAGFDDPSLLDEFCREQGA